MKALQKNKLRFVVVVLLCIVMVFVISKNYKNFLIKQTLNRYFSRHDEQNDYSIVSIEFSKSFDAYFVYLLDEHSDKKRTIGIISKNLPTEVFFDTENKVEY